VEKPDGTLAEFDEPGELVVRTPSLALGYAGNPEAYVHGRTSSGCYESDASPCSTKETFVNG
jgi:acyl-CoA synthetase (AMP-forming)/AMP-acid ligase II